MGQNTPLRDHLMLVHSIIFFILCNVITPRLPDDMTAIDTRLNVMLVIGIVYYSYDMYLAYQQSQTVFDSMIYHHVIAILFSFLFLSYQQVCVV